MIGTFNHEPGFENVPGFTPIDVLDFGAVTALLGAVQPDVVINFVSLGNVDECETKKDFAKQLNFDFVVALVDHLNRTHSKPTLVHFSSNAVYDGTAAPYDEDARHSPINHYGTTKMWADQYFTSSYSRHLLVRPITMIGKTMPFQRGNPLTSIYQKLSAGQPIGLVDDVVVNFLFVDDMVRALEKLLRCGYTGTVNIGGGEALSWYGLGTRVCEVLGFPTEGMARKSIADFPSLAPRPRNTCLDISRVKRLVGFNPTPVLEIIRRLGAAGS